jgi:hypothetical protein
MDVIAMTDGYDPSPGVRRRQLAAATGIALAVLATAALVPALVAGPVTGSPTHGPAVGTAVPSHTATPTPSTTPSRTRPTKPTRVPFPTVRIAAADPRNQRYEVAVISCPTCASGSRVQYLGQGHALLIPLRHIPSAGRRTLTVVYETATDRTLYVSVNDDPPKIIAVHGDGSWITPQRITLSIELPAGDSVLRFFGPAEPAPDLDEIVLR